ncbi:MAG: hypothetical protein HC853_19055 [Anaerolineae bacterium]|nr:hypothetical protein [Anaerolineae bacterium]
MVVPATELHQAPRDTNPLASKRQAEGLTTKRFYVVISYRLLSICFCFDPDQLRFYRTPAWLAQRPHHLRLRPSLPCACASVPGAAVRCVQCCASNRVTPSAARHKPIY